MGYVEQITLNVDGNAEPKFNALSDSVKGFYGEVAKVAGFVGLEEMLRRSITAGVEMNDMLETSAIRLGIVMESLYKYADAADQHAAATADAAAQIATLKDRSTEVLGPLADLLAMNQRLAPAMSAAGVASAQQATDFAILMAKVGDVSGQSYEALAMQISRLVTTGMLARGEFAQTLRAMGVTPDVINSWKAMGTTVDGQSVLIQNLSEKLGAYASGQSALLNTMEGGWTQLTKAIKGDFALALEDTSETLKQAVLGWRDYILDHKDEIVGALKTTFTVAGNVISAFGITAWNAIKDVEGALAGLGENTNWAESIVNAVTVVLKALNDLKMGFLVTLQLVQHPIDAVIAFVAELGADLNEMSARALEAVGLGGVAASMRAQTEAALEATAANNKFVQGVAGITDKVNAQNAALDANAKKVRAILTAQSDVLSGGVHTGFEGEGGGTRVPNRPTASPQLMAAVEAAGQALAKLQGQLAAIGTGPEMSGVLKIEQGFTDTTLQIDKEILALQRVGADPKGIALFRAQMQGLATDIEKTKLDDFIDKLRVKLDSAVADLGAQFQVANSQAAIFAETVKGLAGLDKTEQTLKDMADAVLAWGQAAASLIQDEGDRVQWLTAVWNNYYTTVTQQETALADARARFLEQQRLKDQVAFAEKEGDWQKYLAAVYQQNVAAGQNVTEAWQDALTKTADAAYKAGGGLEAGLLKVWASLKTDGQAVADFVTDTWGTVTQGINTLLTDTFSGKFKSLWDDLKGIFTGILGDFSKMVSQMIARWLFLQVVMGGKGGASGEGASFAGLPSVDENGNPMAGGGILGGLGGGGGWGGGAGIALGAGFGMAAMASGGGGSSAGTIATVVGAIAAAATIPIAGWIVAAIGAIALGISKLFQKSTQEWTTLTGDQIGPTSKGAQGLDVWNAYGTTLGGLGDLMKTGGGNRADIMSYMRGGEIPDEFLRSTNIKFGTGSNEDTQKLWEAYLKDYFPKTLMSMAFGRQATGGYENLPGVGENFQGIPAFSGGAGVTPLTKMLTSLGFTKEALDLMATQIDTRSAEEFTKWLKSLVEVAAAFKEVSGNLNLDRAGVFAKIRTGQDQTSGQFDQTRGDLVQLASELSMYVGDEQITKAKELTDAVAAYWQKQYAWIQNILALEDKADQTVTDLFTKWDNALKTTAQQFADNATLVSDAFAKIGSEQDPQKAADLFNAALSAADAMFGVLANRLNQIHSLMATNDQLLKSLGLTGSEWQDQINPGWRGVQGDAGAAMTNLWAAVATEQKASADDQLTQIGQIQTAVANRYQYEIQTIAQMTAAISAMKQTIAQDIFGYQYQLAGNDPKKQTSMLYGQIQAQEKALAGAKDQAGADAAMSAIRSLLQQYWSLFGNASQDQKAAAEKWIESVLGTSGDEYTKVMGTFVDTLTNERTQLAAILHAVGLDLQTSEKTTSTAIADLKTQVLALKDAFKSQLNKVVDDLIAKNKDLAKAVGDAWEQFGTLNTVVAATTGTAGTGGGGGTGIDGLGKQADATTTALGDFTTALNNATNALQG